MATPEIIAIDGPAASGKSTLGKALAERLGYLYFDTGVMYRAVAWAAIQRGVPVEDDEALSTLADKLAIDVRLATKSDGRLADVFIDQQDVTWEIRIPEVDAIVSIVAAYPGVRRALTTQQRRIGLRGRVVMVGRDIGTVVLPEAGLKLYLDASVEERARRRFRENQGRHQDGTFEEVLDSMRQRDQLDSTRQIAPLRPAEDAKIINSDKMSAEQVLSEALKLVKWDQNEHG